MLINSSIPEDHKTVLANIKDHFPLFVSNIRSAIQVEEENTKKLETRKVNTTELTKLKTKFKAAKAKKMDLEQGVVAARAEVDQLHSLVEKKKPNLQTWLMVYK